MIAELVHTFLLSISPFGEARVGIPYGILQGLDPIMVLAVGYLGNVLVFPILTFLLDKFNVRLWKFKLYKQHSVKIAQRAKKGSGSNIKKYGFWGLFIFVMIPLPITGAYIGTIAAYVFKMKRKQAFVAISLGLIISCGLMVTGAYLGKLGLGF